MSMQSDFNRDRMMEQLEALRIESKPYGRQLRHAIDYIKDLEDSYEQAARHADRGWKFLEIAVRALHKIACFDEGPKVIPSFDEPASAQEARDALYELPTCGVYDDRRGKREGDSA